jgi:hypothetical protein
MITVPTLGAMLTVIGVFLIEAVVLSAIVGALAMRRGARRPVGAWRRSRLLASRADAPGGLPAGVARLTRGAARRVADRVTAMTSSGA